MAAAAQKIPPPPTSSAPSSAPTSAPSRMSLANVKSGPVVAPHKIVLYGPEGVGKSTFGASAPKPIYLPVEEGTRHLDVPRFPKPESWQEAREALRILIHEKHDYQTLVLDTLDALEPLLWKYLIERERQADPKKSTTLRDIEDFGYGKGYTKALEYWRALLLDLEKLNAKGMHVVLLAHSQVKAFKNPAGEDFDRYELKLNQKAAGLFKEWCDSLLFANHETYAKKDAITKRVRGVDTGARLIFTERRAAYDAKHRGNLPESLPLSWGDFVAAAEKPVDPVEFAKEILRRAADLGEDTLQLVTATVEKAAGNVRSLTEINNRVNLRLSEKAAQEEES